MCSLLNQTESHCIAALSEIECIGDFMLARNNVSGIVYKRGRIAREFMLNVRVIS